MTAMCFLYVTECVVPVQDVAQIKDAETAPNVRVPESWECVKGVGRQKRKWIDECLGVRPRFGKKRQGR